MHSGEEGFILKRWFGFLLPILLLLGGCAKETAPELPAAPPAASRETVPPGELRLLYDAEPDSWDRLCSDDELTLSLAADTLDTLLEYDADGRLCPALAETWTYDADTRTWTFTLREDAVWVRSDGTAAAPVTAEDFVCAARYILDPANESPASGELTGLIENAESYYNGLDKDSDDEPIDFSEVGVRATDGRTLCYVLRKDAPDFLARLTGRAFVPLSAEQPEKSGFGAGESLPWSCGAYVLAACEPRSELLLRKNDRFRDAGGVTIETIRLRRDPDAAVTGPELAAEGSLSCAPLDRDTAAAWLADPARAPLVSRDRPAAWRSYFLCFNFNVRRLNTDYTREGMTGWSLDEKYEPENWEKAVNCEAFRQSIRRAVDPAALFESDGSGTAITPARFASDPATGADYVLLGPLSALGEPSDPDLARELRDAARSELAEQEVSFPVKILLRCPENDERAERRCFHLAERLESILGEDYIDVIVERIPQENYWTLVRRGSGYMLLECWFDADSPDVDTWTKPFYQPQLPDGSFGRGYRYAYLASAVIDGTASADTVRDYFALVEKARSEIEPSARLAAFAAAEAHLIDHALAVPLGTGEPSYAVSRVDRSGCPANGLARRSWKGARLLDRPLTVAETIPTPPEPPAVIEPDPSDRPRSEITNIFK